MFSYLTPDEARQTPIYAAVVADFRGGPKPATRARKRDAAGRFVKTAPARWCRVAGCGRSTASHLWDAETCPAPEAGA